MVAQLMARRALVVVVVLGEVEGLEGLFRRNLGWSN